LSKRDCGAICFADTGGTWRGCGAKRGEYVLPLGIAWIYIGLGDKDQAFVWLDKSFEDRSDGMREIKTNPIYDPLRSDPRFTDLLKRMRLPT